MYRTHTCNGLTGKDEGQRVKLAGWIHNLRSHGNITFVDLRDRHGVTQIVVNDSSDLKKESVIRIEGEVKKRPQVNKDLPTGEIEVHISSLEIINKSETLPLDIEKTNDSNTRMKYRYLDLRNKDSFKGLILRHKVKKAAHDYFNEHNFLELETPMLVKSTPEGARDYVVPSRVNKGKFYALPQSPQLYKQLLMIAGADRYYQVARALRDEDLRADRQPEHTQLDFEMSFVESDEIRTFVEGLMKHIFKQALDVELEDFETFTFEEALNRFGSDKPDIRFGFELKDVTSIAKETDFKIFQEAESVNAIVFPEKLSRKEIDELTELAKIHGAKGLAYAYVENGLESGISKFLKEKEKDIIEKTGAEENNTVLFVADKWREAREVLGQIRIWIRDKLNLVKSNEFKFCWVTDFPLFVYDEDEGRWEPEHHMFSMPKKEWLDKLEESPGEVKADLFDLALNGWELGSGSMRVSNPDLQRRIMNIIGLSEEEAKEKFGFLLDAYKYGGPEHGGMGLGLDRIVALMNETPDIREVIAFPKNKHAENPMDGSPGVVSKEQLDDLGLKLK